MQTRNTSQDARRNPRKDASGKKKEYRKPVVRTEPTLERQVLGSPTLIPGKPGC